MSRLVRRLAPVFAALALGACASMGQGGSDAGESRSGGRGIGQVMDDTRIGLEVNDALQSEDRNLYKEVGSVVYRGRVLLVGVVPSEAARQRAGAISAAHSGVREVLNEVQVTTDNSVARAVNDTIITKRIQLKFFWDKTIDSSNIKVRSVNGVVYLIGLAGTREEYEGAARIAREAEDVRRVVNYLSVRS